MSLYKQLSPYIFKIDPELAHQIVSFGLSRIAPLPLVQDYLAHKYCVVDEALCVEVAGIKFYNPVGIAAGFDKNATMVKGLSTLGFGFVEVGTITHNPQEGNPKPRIFRYEQEKSIQNMMGFNNAGSGSIGEKLKTLYPYALPIGVNIGKNRLVAQEDSLKSYEYALLDLLDVGDYYVFNLSSPNTPNLRDLQNVLFVQELLSLVRTHTNKPLFLKISPDMDIDSMLEVVQTSIETGANGIIVSNTTIDYSVLPNVKQSGGISGEALKEKSKEALRLLAEAFFGQTLLVSVGGIDSAKEAYERIKLGASLVQVFSAMVFEGPALCRNINQGLLELLAQDGYATLSQAIGQGIDKKPRRLSKSAQEDSKTMNSETKSGKSSRKSTSEKPKSQKINAKKAQTSNMINVQDSQDKHAQTRTKSES